MPQYTETAQMERRGITYLAEVCREMGYIWRETSNSDVGFDGEIELVLGVDATAQIIKVQSKAGKSYLRNNSQETFDFYADANQLEYWNGATNPVILFIFDPEEKIGYWKDVKKYLSHNPDVVSTRPHKLTFNKRRDRFIKESSDPLRKLFDGDLESFELVYRQHLIDRYSKLTLYSVTSDAPIAVDLERIFVKLNASQQRDRSTVNANLAYHLRSRNLRENISFEYQESSEDRTEESHFEVHDQTSLTLSISEALNSYPTLLVIGAPGAGKTTLLKYLALTFVRDEGLGRLQLHENRLPIFVALRDFSRYLDNLSKAGELLDFSPQLLDRFINDHLRMVGPQLQVPTDFITSHLQNKSCIVLLDGLDEVADSAKRARVAEAVASILVFYRGNRFVITSRPRGYEGEPKQRLSPLCAQFTIRDFDDEDVSEFASNWYEAVTRDRLGDTSEAVAESRLGTEDLLRAIYSDKRVKALAHNPLLLSVLAMVHQRGVGLPQRRAELYDECTDLLLGYWDQTKGGEAARELALYGELSRSEKRALLEPVALWFHERGAQGLEADKKDLMVQIASQFRTTFGDTEAKATRRAELFLEIIDERAGLLVERDAGVYAFAHLTFQEYLAARAIADREDYVNYTKWRLHDPWWREVVLLEVVHLSDVRSGGNRARKLTSDLIWSIYTAGSRLEAVLRRDLLLAARCLSDAGKLGVPEELRQTITDELVELWKTSIFHQQQREIADVFSYMMPTTEGAIIRSELTKALSDNGNRQKALETIMQLRTMAAYPEILKHLLQLTVDQDAEVRVTSIQSIGKIGGAAATTEIAHRLLELTADPNLEVRHAAIQSLTELGSAAASKISIRELLSFLVNSEEDIGYVTTWKVRYQDNIISSTEALDRVLPLVSEADEDVRLEAVETLFELSEAITNPETAAALEDVTSDLGYRLETSPGWLSTGMVEEAETDPGIERLLSQTADANDMVRSAALRVLGEIGRSAASPAILETLLSLTFDRDEVVRRLAIEAIKRMGALAAVPQVITRVIELTEDSDVAVRHTAVQTLGEMGASALTRNTVERLTELFQEEDNGIRAEAVWAIGEIGCKPLCSQIMKKLSTMTGDRDATVRKGIASAVGKIGIPVNSSALEILVKFCGDTDPSVRAESAWALGNVGGTGQTRKIIRLLTTMLADTKIGVRRQAVSALAKLSSFTKLPNLSARLLELSKETDVDIRQAAVTALGSLPNVPEMDGVMRRLYFLTKDERSTVRSASATALGALSAQKASRRTVSALLALSTDVDVDVRFAAVTALEKIRSSLAKSEIFKQLIGLWQNRLSNTSFEHSSGGTYRRVCDVAYEELASIVQQLTPQLQAGHNQLK